MRKIKDVYKDVYYNIKYFIINSFKFKKFLADYREYSGNYFFEDFIKNHIDNMIKFYSKEENCMQVDESRIEILSELKVAKALSIPAFDSMYFLRELPEEACEIDNIFEEVTDEDGRIYHRMKNNEWDWTSEEMKEASAKYLEARVEFFNYLEQHYCNWWD